MRKRAVSNTFKYLFLTIVTVISVFPFFWMIISATNTTVDINRSSLLPGGNLMTNLHNLFTSDLGFVNSLKNSAVIALVATFLALLISSLAGYGFETFRSKKRDALFSVLLLSIMVPFSALMIPLFRLFSSFNNSGLNFIGLDTLSAVIIPGLSTAFLVFFFRQSTKSFPKDILEAARIDGMSEPGIFFKMYIPVMKSTFSAAAIITFMANWNSYLWPLVALQSPDKRTVPLILSTMGASYTPDYGMIMSGIVIATIPTALIFFLMQKQFVQGMIGSVK
jgi:ABC-type sugar transport system, permease component